MICPTPPDKLVDLQNRPYFLWDSELTIDEFREKLRDPSETVRSYMLGKLMRQAKPDDVFLFVSREEIIRQWSAVEPFLGKTRPFWSWLVEQWKGKDHGGG
jgi:hypothetical protein